MITLKYLRTLDFEDLVKEYNYYRNHQLKWGSILEEYNNLILEEYNSKLVKDKNEVREKVDYYTKIINKISKIMVEKGG